MWLLYVVLIVIAVLGIGFLGYKYGRKVENRLWMDFMAVRGFSEREFERMKNAFAKGFAVAEQGVKTGVGAMQSAAQKIEKKF